MTPIEKEKNTHKGYWLGKQRSQETKDKLSKALLGRRVSKKTEFKKGNEGFWTGKKRDPEMVKRNAEKLRGRKMTPEQLEAHIARTPRGENNPNWKGAKASYEAQHSWVRRHKGVPSFCEKCGVNKPPIGKKSWFEWANISGEYHRDLNDYMSLCPNCHQKMDKRRSPDRLAVFITAFGETKRLVEWSEDPRCVVNMSCLRRRTKMYGYDPETAITKPSIRS